MEQTELCCDYLFDDKSNTKVELSLVCDQGIILFLPEKKVDSYYIILLVEMIRFY